MISDQTVRCNKRQNWHVME